MMDTKSKRVFAVLLMCCIAYLNAQHNEKIMPDEFKNNLYQIMFQQVSPNGKWAAFKKAYEKTNDTLVVINVEKRNDVILEVGEVGNFFFAANSMLFYQKNNEIIQYNIPAKKQQVWKNISEYYYWEDQKKFILFEKSSGLNSVFIIDENGKELERFMNAQMIKIIDQSVIIITKSETKFLVWRYNGEHKSQVFKYDNKISGILNVSNKGIVFIEESPSSKHLKICYFNIEHQRVKKLSDSWNRKVQQVKTFFIDDSNKIFLKTSVKKDVVPKEVVDIWYGNAKDLRTKFYEKDQEMIDIIWNPEIDSVAELANSKCTTYFSFGNNKDILCLDEFKNEDFTGRDKTYPIFKYQIENKDYSEVGDVGSSIIVDRNGRYLLSKQSDQWHLYNVSEMKQEILPHFESLRASFSKDSKSIVFEGKGSISIYNINSNKVERIDLESGVQIEIVNSEKEYLAGNLSIYRNVIDLSKPIVVKLTNPDNYTMGLAIICKGKVQYIERNIAHRINSVKWDRTMSKIIYVVEDANLPPQLRSYKKQSDILYDSNLEDKIARTIESRIYMYKNSKGQNIQGVLLFPVSFNPNRKYPLIVNIYENQSKQRNQFLLDGFSGSTDAFNIRYYLKRGYFVFLPDIIYDERGTGWSALDSVESGLESLKGNSSLDLKNVALIGFSHGGYETNFIATHSKLFKTYLAGGGNSDLVRSYFSFNYNFYSPFYFQFENGQYRMGKPFTEDKDLYVKNSPVYFADRVNAPVLLWAGMKDQNIYWEQTMEFYLSLKRNNKHVIALFYPNEAHGFQKVESKLDIFTKVSDWIDYYLKDVKVDWIQNMYNSQ